VNPHLVVLIRPLLATTAEPDIIVAERSDGREVTLRWPGTVDTVRLPNREPTSGAPGARPALVRSSTGPTPFAWSGEAVAPVRAGAQQRHGGLTRRWLRRWMRA
jgi:hypothetical protein